MAYDEGLADRVRKVLAGRDGIVEKRMFGGLTFMLHGNMCCGVVNDDLVLRLGLERAQRALEKPHTRVFDFTGRPMKGLIMVGPGGYRTDDDLEQWLQLARDYASSLPAK